MSTILFWFVGAILVGIYAEHKGRSGLGFFFLSLLLSPIIGALAAIVARSSETLDAATLRQGGQSANYKLCPLCAETIRQQALRCRHCGANLEMREEGIFTPEMAQKLADKASKNLD